MAAFLVADLGNRCRRIHVALHKMAVEAPSGDEAAFEVYFRSWLPGVKAGLFQCFPYGRNLVGVAGNGFYGETNPVVGHALVNRKSCR